jgi:hypothetical protein
VSSAVQASLPASRSESAAGSTASLVSPAAALEAQQRREAAAAAAAAKALSDEQIARLNQTTKSTFASLRSEPAWTQPDAARKAALEEWVMVLAGTPDDAVAAADCAEDLMRLLSLHMLWGGDRTGAVRLDELARKAGLLLSADQMRRLQERGLLAVPVPSALLVAARSIEAGLSSAAAGDSVPASPLASMAGASARVDELAPMLDRLISKGDVVAVARLLSRLTPVVRDPLVRSLATSSPKAAVSLCVHLWPHVSPKAVAALLPAVEYLAYLDSLLAIDSPGFLRVGPSKYAECVLMHIQAALTDRPPAASKLFAADSGGTQANSMPLGGSHRLRWPRDTTLGVYLSEANMPLLPNPRALCDLFLAHGYWKGFLRLAVLPSLRAELVGTLAGVLVALGDADILTRAPLPLDLYRLLLARSAAVAESTTVGLSVSDVLRCLVMQCGVEESLKLVGSVAPMPAVSSEQLSALLRAERVMASYRSQVSSSLVALDTYLWSQRPAPLHPALVQASLAELAGQSAPPSQQGPGSAALPATLEDSGGQWASRIAVAAQCPVCDGSQTDGSSLVTFPCGHVSHADCLALDACPICFHRNLQPGVA